MGTLFKAIVAIGGMIKGIGNIISKIKNRNRIKKDEKEEAELEDILTFSDSSSRSDDK